MQCRQISPRLADGLVSDTRQDFQHEIYLFTMNGRLGRAPVKEPRDVLGVATGTGIWAVQYGL